MREMKSLEQQIEKSEWNQLIILVQTVFRDKKVPQEMENSYLLMIPKQDTNKLRGIGIIDITWKIIAYIIKNRIGSKISLHKDIHGFRFGNGTRTAIMQSKIWTSYQNSLNEVVFKIFLDVKAAYDTVSRTKLIQILSMHGVKNMLLSIL